MTLYQNIVDQNIGLLRELDELDRIRHEVMAQMGFVEDGSRLRAVLIFQWIFRLYVRKKGGSVYY
ncbi:MAG: hypothetical protein H5T50_08275 [Nitrososphaeria archaeon]|nr:hypothetical protein [Nitrososphaeria archaeon]